MKETQPISPEILNSAIRRALLIEAEREVRLPADINAVWVFGGAGTYSKPLRENDEPWQENMDRDRILTGIILVHALTAQQLKSTKQASVKDVADCGPLFVYNGTSEQNSDLRKALETGKINLPSSKVIILDDVMSAETTRPITNTADQIASFYQELARVDSPLGRCHRVAQVSHSPHFVRIPHYIRHFEEELLRKHGRLVNYFVFGVKSNQEGFNQFVREELNKLAAYISCGHLSSSPTPHLTIV